MIDTGTRLGPYVVVRRLGAGGMGEVYLASDPRLEREVAIKVLPFEFSFDPELLERFQREAKLLASVNHPNIATIYGLEEGVGGVRCLIMERIEGVTLTERIMLKPMPVEAALDMAVQLAEALEAAHERGVIHRDLKPSNVMITPRGQVKVLDFGLAKRSDDLADQAARSVLDAGNLGEDDAPMGLTLAGDVLGTPGYMSPEQILALPQDLRTDIFSFGSVLYECLTRKAAFPGKGTLEITAATVHDEPDWQALPAEPRAKLKQILSDCLEKDPEKRPPNMGLVRAALREMLAPAAAVAVAAPVAAPNNLPRQISSFVGREEEASSCAALLLESRLLTLTGPGGCGKTRLALNVAERFLPQNTGGTWFVDLAPLSEPKRVPQALAAALGVREETGRELVAQLAEHLGAQPTLVVLDNCEHLLEACAALVSVLLDACQGVRVLATSREALGLGGEQTYVVPSLSVPDPRRAANAAAVMASSAGRLFAERASLVNASFEVNESNARGVAEILQRLDGIPLAIELAAARIKLLSVDQIRAKLDDRFRLLTSGSRDALPRQQTLRATIQWSYDQLVEEEQRLMRALSVFVGGWTLEAATAICGEDLDEFEVLDTIGRLADKSLVVVERSASADARYRFLETVRQYAQGEREAKKESPALRARHLSYFLALAEQAAPLLRGGKQSEWLARLDSDNANLLAAHVWCGEPPEHVEEDLRLVGALWRFWYNRGHFRDGSEALHAALSRPGAERAGALRAGALGAAAGMAFLQSEFDRSRLLYEELARLCEELGDRLGLARAFNGLGIVALAMQDYRAAEQDFEKALAIYRELGDQANAAVALGNLGNVSLEEGDYSAAGPRIEAALELARTLGDEQGVAKAYLNGAMVCTHSGNPDGARERLRAGLPLVLQLGERRYAAYALETSAELAALLSEHPLAARLSGAAAGLREELGAPLPETEMEKHELAMQLVREGLGGDGFAREWNEGRSMNYEAALDSVLRWLSG